MTALSQRWHEVSRLRRLSVGLAAFIVLALAAPEASARHGKVLVANRASGTISVIDPRTDKVIETLTLPQDEGEPNPEPMYINHTLLSDLIWIGDRANDRVVAFDARTFEVVGTLPTGDGPFHMATDALGFRLVVVNDLDKTLTVIDALRGEVVATVELPADLVEAGAIPHDVILDPLGIFAYVTFHNVPGNSDAVVQLELWRFTEFNRAAVGKSPHIAFNWRNWDIYVPCQGSNAVFVLDGLTLKPVDAIDVPGAHGAIVSNDGRRFYTTNLPGLGKDAVHLIDTRTNTVRNVADAPNTVPHNVALTADSKKLYVTHSGTNNVVSVYDTSKNGKPVFRRSITVGNNPFAIAVVP
jgi:YVTN family beta-propeller protein